MITESPQLMDISHLFNAMQLAVVFVIYMIPSMIIAFSVYALYRYRKKRKLMRKRYKEENKSAKEELKKRKKAVNKSKKVELSSDMLDSVDLNSTVHYGSLNLEFDAEGHVKQSKEKRN